VKEEEAFAKNLMERERLASVEKMVLGWSREHQLKGKAEYNTPPY
jgi:hypothetical protein